MSWPWSVDLLEGSWKDVWKYKPHSDEGMSVNEWTSVKEGRPQDDQTVFVINSKVQMLPVKAYYCEEWQEFMSLENGDGCNHPLSITHWMPMPKYPEEK